MIKTLLPIVLGTIALGAGVALVVVADRQGWLDSAPPDAATEQCRHGLDSGRCPFCEPSLIESLGWCAGHDVPEALCTRCNPAITVAFQVEGDWCAEHGLPESQCQLCNASSQTTAVSAEPEGPRVFRSPSSSCDKVTSVVQLASGEVADRAGFAVERVDTQTIRRTVDASVELVFDGNRFAHLAARASGFVTAVHAGLGDEVASGQLLAEVDSAELGSAKAALLQARTLVELWEGNHAREQRLLDRSVATERDVAEAATRLVESRIGLRLAEQQLRNLGLSEEVIAAVVELNDTSSRLPVRAPFAGTVVQRHAVIGEVVDSVGALFAIADTSSMWAMLDVYESDIAQVRIGQSVEITLQGLPGRTFEGRITWISAEVDARTRTLGARAVIDNTDGLLRANMFGQAAIVGETIPDAVLVPKESVQWEGCCNVVFVKHTDTVYQPYRVQLLTEHGDYYVVGNGLPPGESVVTRGSFLLKTEILKGNIGAGCCEVDPGAAR